MAHTLPICGIKNNMAWISPLVQTILCVFYAFKESELNNVCFGAAVNVPGCFEFLLQIVVCVCMCVCVCVHVCVCDICTNIYTCVCMIIYIPVCVRVCMY